LICDFGVSSIFTAVNSGMTRRKSFVGTPSFIARELVLRPVGIADAKQPAEIVQQKHYDYKCDIWSFGILAFELSTGKPPNPFSTVAAVLQKTVTEDSPSIDREGGQYKYSKAFKELVDTCLQKDPAQRCVSLARSGLSDREAGPLPLRFWTIPSSRMPSRAAISSLAC
jgi:serine/threonine protein kinase